MGIRDTSGQDVVLERKSRPGRPVYAAVAVVAVVGLAWLVMPAFSRWASASITVPVDRLRIATVTRGDLVRDVSVQGRVIAAVRPTVYAPAPGTITLEVEAGASVKRGDVLARIDSPDLDAALSQARATRDQLSVQLERQRIESRQQALEKRKQADLAEVALVAAEREKRRADAANEVSVIAQADFEKAQDDLRNAELAHKHALEDAALFDERLAFEIRASELELSRQQLEVDDLERRVGALAIESPVDGVVGDLLVDQKAAVARDMAIMSVVDLTRFEIEAEIPESYADDLGLGMAAEILVGNRVYTGQLVAVSPEIVNGQVASRIRFGDERPSGLRQNQRLTTRILIESRPDVLQVQRGQFLESGGGRVAYVLDGSGLALRRDITTGARSLGSVEITAGLAEGDQVVISTIEPFRGASSVLLSD